MSMYDNKRVCPKCYFANETFAKVCIKCGYPLLKESATDSNPKAPKKVCPSCGTRVYINRAVCPECDYEFEFKSKKSVADGDKANPKKSDNLQSSTNDKQNLKTTPVKHSEIEANKINRSPGAPIISYLLYLIPISIWSVVCYFLMPFLNSKIGGWAFIVNIVAFFISIVFGMFFGSLAEDSYGYRSSGYALLISLFSTMGVLVFAFLQLKPVWTSGYFWDIFFPALNYSCTPLIILAGVITEAKIYYSSIKEHYCIMCGMANLVFFEKSEDGESHVEYKFVTHEAKNQTATITSDSSFSGFVGSVNPEHFSGSESTTHTIKYKTPEWQENLGLHKYTKYTDTYRCRRCGHIKKENRTREEKL